MSGHEEGSGSDSERINMLEVHQHREGGLTNGTRTAFDKEVGYLKIILILNSMKTFKCLGVARLHTSIAGPIGDTI